MCLNDVGIMSVSYSAPDTIVTNNEIEQKFGIDKGLIKELTMIDERRIAGDEIAFSDLAVRAGKEAISAADISPSEIGVLVVATSSDDYYNPKSGAFLQRELGTDAFVLNIDQSCAGGIYAISTAAHLMLSKNKGKALVIAGDCDMRKVSGDSPFFIGSGGDACGAMVLGKLKKGKKGILSESFGTAGEYYENFGLYNYGSRVLESSKDGPTSYEQSADGNVILFKVLRWFKKSLKECLDAAGMLKEDVDFYSPHPAAVSQIKLQMKSIKVDIDKTNLVSSKFGHSGSGTHFIILNESINSKRLAAGDSVFMFGNGSGFLWGGMLINWCSLSDFERGA